MKPLLTLGALLLSASAVIADDLIYLKCNGTVQFKEIDSTEKKILKEINKEVTIHYEIDAKKQLLVDSSDPKDPSAIKIWNGMIFEQIKLKEGTMTGNIHTQIAYDLPGKIAGRSTVREDDSNFEYVADLAGSCEASDASAYEASK